MQGKLGPLLLQAMERMEAGVAMAGATGALATAAHVGLALEEVAEGRLPIVAKLPRIQPRAGENFEEYSERVRTALVPTLAKATDLGVEPRPLILGNSIAATAPRSAAERLAEDNAVDYVELDPKLQVVDMDDAIIDVGAEPFRQSRGDLRGKGVRVAVLDSGVDTAHPFLDVSDSVSVTGEPVEIPGSHGTHCAGSIASHDAAFPGIAPDVTLINVKVLDHLGRGTHTDIMRGVDAALARAADVLSMSLGFNHLPAWSDRGHGWSCPDGRCPLCAAVDNAVDLGVVVVVAAGNEHERADALRAQGHGDKFDTELGCPGQARGSICVAAITKNTFLPAGFSSRGPTSYGVVRPDLATAGVNIMSTIPAPRGPDGTPIPNPPRNSLFGRNSGTSMATPIVAGAAALLIELLRQRGLKPTPAELRQALLQGAVAALPDPAMVVGAGRLDLRVAITI